MKKIKKITLKEMIGNFFKLIRKDDRGLVLQEELEEGSSGTEVLFENPENFPESLEPNNIFIVEKTPETSRAKFSLVC